VDDSRARTLYFEVLPLYKQSDCACNSDMVFSAAEIVSFLSQGTTLKAGTIIMTGTPAGVGVGQDPKNWLHGGDEFAVEILPHIGTLVTKFEEES
jgi:2-keto-4-pentenoate hydratase/2-oxohepta-3-ene-1,7-dioic acid hydratase in catechol pathway